MIYNGYEPYREYDLRKTSAPLLPGIAEESPVVGIVANFRPGQAH